MNYVGRFFSTCKDFYNDINAATLTGAIDVIVVEQEDGTLSCSPFHVRFGKLGVLRYKGKTVDIRVNGEEVCDLSMRLGDSGIAYFVDEPVSIAEDDDATVDEDKEGKPPRRSASCSSLDRSGPPSAEGTPANDGTGHGSKGHRRNISTDSDVSFKSFQPAGSFHGDADEKFLQADNVSMLNLEVDSKNTRALPRRSSLSSQNMQFHLAKSPISKSMCGLPNVNLSPYPQAKMFRSYSNPDIRIPSYLEDERMRAGAGGRPTALEQAFAEGMHSLSDSELCHDGGETPGEQQMSWPWGGMPTTEPEVTIKTKGESTPAHASSTKGDSEMSTASKPSAPVHIDAGSQLETQSRGSASTISTSSSAIVSMVTRLWGASDDKSDPAKSKGGVYLSDLDTVDMDPTTRSLYFLKRQSDHARASSLPTPVPLLSRSPAKSDSEVANYPPQSVLDASSLSSSAPSGDSLQSIQHIRSETYSDSGASSMPGSPPPGDSRDSLGSESSSSSKSPLEAAETTSDLQALLSAPGNVEFSNCGGLKDSEKEPDRFAEYRISYEEFSNKPDLLHNSALVVRIRNKYYTWQAAAPIIMSMVVYGKSLPEKTHHSLMKQHMPRKRRFMWFWRGEEPPPPGTSSSRSLAEVNTHMSSTAAAVAPYHHGSFSSDDDIGDTDEVTLASDDEGVLTPRPKQDTAPAGSVIKSAAADEVDLGNRLQHSQSLPVGDAATRNNVDPWQQTISFEEDEPGFHSYLRLPSDKLKQLRLKDGANTFTFSVTTKYQGTTACEATVYLWHHKDKVVVSDVDGTITRSDVYGQVLPLFGQDWSHFGVAQLFSGIERNGYRFIYLSARAIGQSKLTRDYLRNIRQGQLSLPDGPLLLNPSSLVRAFHREVIMKNPQEFKIAALSDVGSLFCARLTDGPYYAGFGNRMSDVITYIAVGVPKARIFTINPNGVLRHEFIRTFKSTYTDLADLLDQFFPPRDEVDAGSPVAYNQFNYWRSPMPSLEEPGVSPGGGRK